MIAILTLLFSLTACFGAGLIITMALSDKARRHDPEAVGYIDYEIICLRWFVTFGMLTAVWAAFAFIVYLVT